MDSTSLNGVKGVIPEKNNRFPLKTQVEIIMRPYTHISQTSLPEMWNNLGLAFNKWLNVPEDDLKKIEEIIDMHQHYNLLLDDIQDNRNTRGEMPSAHCIYGITHTISAYFYLLTQCGTKVHALSRKLDKLSEELIRKTCLARCVQLLWRDAGSCPKEEDYYKMIVQRSYGLLITKIKFMQVLSESRDDFVRLAKLFGLYLEILNDYRRLKSIDNNICDDINLLQFNLPIIHAITNQSEHEQTIIYILRRRTNSQHVKSYLLSILEQSGSFEYTQKVLAQIRDKILNELKKFNTENCLIKEFIENNFCMGTWINDNEKSSTKGVISLFMEEMEKIEANENFETKQILRPYRHLSSVPGKNIRTKYMQFINTMLNVDAKMVSIIEHIGSYCHEASLLIDDIQDGSELRRGIPAAHQIYGIANTTNTATYLIAAAIKEVFELNKPEAMDICLDQMEKMCRSQQMEIYWRDQCICPSETEYLDMVLGKSSSPFLVLAKLMELFVSNKKSTVKQASAMGQFLQINDDYQNLTNQVYYDKKGFCEDLTEGKFGFPTIYAINNHPKAGRIILDILRERTHEVETKKRCLAIIEVCGGFEHTKRKLRELRNVIAEEIKEFGGSTEEFEAIETMFFVDCI